MLNQPADAGGPEMTLSEANFGLLPAVHGLSRLEARFYGDAKPIAAARASLEVALPCSAALSLGLVTSGPDALDWDDEVRIALEERGCALARRLDRHGSQFTLRPPRDSGDAGVRPAWFGLAELDFHPAQCSR